MPKWEYALMTMHIGGVVMETSCEFTIFHVDRKNESNSGSFGHIIALAGEQGWELVGASARIQPGVVLATANHKIDYIFKRQLAETPAAA